MSIQQENSYVVGSNNDLSNALVNIDLNRIGTDLTYLEDDGGTLKVSAGSLIEHTGSMYSVTGAAETPSGTAEDGAYLFFNPAGPEFAWSTTPGVYDPARGGIYDGAGRRQCRFRLRSSTTWDQLVVPESADATFEGNLKIDGTTTLEDGGQAAGFDASSTSFENDLPVGSIIAARQQPFGSLERYGYNEAVTVTDVGAAGEYRIDGSGTAMAGTWRVRGNILYDSAGSQGLVLVQRTA